MSRRAHAPRFRPPRRLSFTRTGKYFVGMTLLVGLGAINTGNNLLYLILGMMLALILLSGVLSELALQKLVPGRRLPERVFAGRPALLELTLRNDKPRAASFSVQVIERVTGLAAAARPTGYVLHVGPRNEAWARAALLVPRRGVWRLEGWELATRFPFGLFRKSREIDQPARIIAFPPLLPAPAGDWLAGTPLGESRRGRLGRGGELYGVREHRPGDDLRDVHWKLTARRGQPVSREYEQPSSPQLTLCFDNRWPPELPGGGSGADEQGARARLRDELEHAVAVCAGLAADLIGRGFVCGLLTREARVPPGSGPAQLDRLLHALARLRFIGDPAGSSPPDPAAGEGGGEEPAAGGGAPEDLSDPAGAASAPPLAEEGEACLLVGHADSLQHWAGGVLVGTVPCRGSLAAALAAAAPAGEPR